MHLRILWVMLVTLQGVLLNAQTPDSLNRDAAPIGGLNALALNYLKINFTKEQRTILSDAQLEFIYTVDEKGKPTLEKIHGISDTVILDSLTAASRRTPDFYPQIEQGQPVPSIFTFVIRFPSYQQAGGSFVTGMPAVYKTPAWEDFEYIRESGDELCMYWGVLGNGFVGNASRHLRPGGGMRVDMSIVGKKGWGGGMFMRFYGNTLYNPYSLNPSRVQNPAPPTILIGLGGIRRLSTWQRSKLDMQVELHMAAQNVSPKLSNTDKDFLQLTGVSPGVLVNYGVQLGNNSLSYSYGSPTVVRHYLVASAAVRPMIYGFREARGMMIELGLSYRLSAFIVEAYQLKPGK